MKVVGRSKMAADGMANSKIVCEWESKRGWVDVWGVSIFVSEEQLYFTVLLGTDRPGSSGREATTLLKFLPLLQVLFHLEEESGCDEKLTEPYLQPGRPQIPPQTLPPQCSNPQTLRLQPPWTRAPTKFVQGETRWQMNTQTGPVPSQRADRRNSWIK